jgi:transposase
MSAKKCPACGTKMDNEARCPNCGHLDTSAINLFIFAFSAATIIIFIVFGFWIITL